MKTLMNGLLKMYTTAIRLILKDGELLHEVYLESRKRSRAIETAAYYEYDAAREALHEIMEQKNEHEADRWAIVENMHDATVRGRQEVTKMIEDHLATDPGKVDSVAMELLRNDMYSDQELQKEAERFKDNPTMLRLIGKYAARRDDPDMKALADEIERKHGSQILEAFDEFVKIGDAACKKACAWRTDSPSADDQVEALEKAERPIICKMIDAFNKQKCQN